MMNRVNLSKGVVVSILSILLAACAGDRPQNLGIRDGRLASCPSTPNCVSSQAAEEKQRIAPLAFKGNPQEAFALLKKVLAKRGDITFVEEKDGYLRVEARTRLFVDDAEFLLALDEGCIHVRSASRLGYSDLGKNRSRMEEVRKAFGDAQGR